MTNKRWHLTVTTMWVALLIVAMIVLRGRLFPNGAAAAARDAPNLRPPPPAGSPPSGADHPLVAIHQALRATNPDYNARGQFQMADGQITIADLSGTGIVDPAPLMGLPLEALDLSENPITDLTALSGMPLKRLALEATEVTDLAPLRGMKLKGLYLNRTRITSLSPLQGMPLELLNLYETDVADLTPLRGLPLKYVWLNGTRISDISPIANCPLVSLTLERTPVFDLSPLAANKTLRRLHIGQSAVTDLSPLAAMQLDRLICDPSRITKGLGVVRDMNSIREIGLTLDQRMPPERFWGLYDLGAFGRADRR